MMSALTDILDYFNNVDDDEIPRLYQQAVTIISRVEGSSSENVAMGEYNLAAAYDTRSKRSLAVNDLDRCIANLELTLPHYREASRIFRLNNHVDRADDSLRRIFIVENKIRQFKIARATAATR